MNKKQITVIPKEKFEALLLNKEYPFEDRKNLVRKEFDIDLPDEIQDGQEFVDLVYDKYQEMLKLYEIDVNRVYKKKTKVHGEQTRKEFIIETIKEKQKITFNELLKIVDEKYGYGDVGKTPRVRVNKVIKDLEKRRKVFKDLEGYIIWKGDMGSKIISMDK